MAGLTSRPGRRIVRAMAERVYRPRWNCRLRLWHRWRTYRSDTGELYRRPSTGPVPLEGLYQECLDCRRDREMGHWEPSSGGGGGVPG